MENDTELLEKLISASLSLFEVGPMNEEFPGDVNEISILPTEKIETKPNKKWTDFSQAESPSLKKSALCHDEGSYPSNADDSAEFDDAC